MIDNNPIHSPIDCINHPLLIENKLKLSILREDLIHPTISGNKFRKLKYNLLELKNQNKKTLLTFGGAFSNHISATAAAGKIHNIKTIGIIRGDELKDKINTNPTLRFAKSCDMELHFVSRSEYSNKENPEFINDLKIKFGDFYYLPEGGTNLLATKGCTEILYHNTKDFDFICCPVGTGGTIAGIINASEKEQKILGFPVLKNAHFLINEINQYTKRLNYDLFFDFHVGGYAKVNEELISFVNQFKKEHQITLDPIYTGKMMLGIFSLIKKGYFPKHSKILAIHTGGLQGIEGINITLKKKNKETII